MQIKDLAAFFRGVFFSVVTASRCMTVSRFILIVLLVSSLQPVRAQESRLRSEDQITAPVDPSRKRILPDNLIPEFVTASTDEGRLSPFESIGHLMLVLNRPPQRQAAFESLLHDLYSKDSPSYQQWLTPAQIGADYGPSDNDIAQITTWLNSQGLRVEEVADSRVVITFTGTSDQLEKAFSTELHRYKRNGVERVSINSQPTIPTALGSIVRNVVGLSTLSDHPTLVHSDLTPGPSPLFDGGPSGHAIFPGDFATIYDLNILYQAGIKGAGQKVAIIGKSRVTNQDIEDFESLAGLPIQDPIVVIPTLGTDPQQTGDANQVESTLDVDRVWGTAPGATVSLVVSASNANGDGITLAAQYAIQNNLAPIVSISYGQCEASAGKALTQLYDNLFSQAAAQGISVFVGSGDAAIAGCAKTSSTPPLVPPAPAINYICASGYATCVGGTEFVEGGAPQTWGSNSSTYSSALNYIPEGAWNDSTSTYISGTGGGPSTFISKPSWQTGTGVPSDGARDTPDISFSASPNHDPYAICAAFDGSSCAKGIFDYIGGTSAAAPGMAGIQALVNQRVGHSLGNINPLLYSSAANASLNVFHDVTPTSSGVSNCVLTTPSLCNNSTSGPPAKTSAGVQGYAVTTGYDMATGLGSIDGFDWEQVADGNPTRSTPTLTLTANPQLVGDKEPSLTSTFTATLANATNPISPITITATCIDTNCSPITLGSGVPTNGVFKVSYTFPVSARAYSITASFAADINNKSATSAPVLLTDRLSSSGIQSYTNLVPNQTQVDTSGKTRNFSLTATVNGSLFEPPFTTVTGLILVGKVQLLVDGLPTDAIASLPGVGTPNPGTVTISSSLPDYAAHNVVVLYYGGTLDPCGCVAAGYAPDGPASSSQSQGVTIAFAGVSPATLTFGSQTTGTTSAAQAVSLQSSSQAAMKVSSISITGTNASDFAQANTCGASLAAAANCTISVTFKPTATGTRTATLTVVDDATGSPSSVTLTGTGAAPTLLPGVTLSPTSLTFAGQTVGTVSAAQSVTLTNSGQAALTLSSIAASGDFAETNTCGTSVAAGANCTMSVTYTPSAAGAGTGTLTITDNASGSPQKVALTGTGTTFGVSSSSTGLTASAGASATAPIQVAGVTGTVNLTCVVNYQGQGTPISPPTCSLNPTQVQISGTSPASSTLTVSTTAASASLTPFWVLKGSSVALAMLLLSGVPRRRWRGGRLLAVLCLVAIAGMSGCSGGSSNSGSGSGSGGSGGGSTSGTTKGNYQVVVTATSGSATTSTTILLTVQ
jgi:hypothetical protein